MIAMMKEEKNRIHPLKFVMWGVCASIVMMFAGLSSAYIVKSAQANWLSFDVPLIFWYSTGVIILSSITIILSRKAFLDREIKKYKSWLGVTTLLGIAFICMQYMGFSQLWSRGITLTRNVSFSFLYVIVGLHALHVLGGVVALALMLYKAFAGKTKVYGSVGVEVMAVYWHFVDLLWIYLLIFFLIVGLA